MRTFVQIDLETLSRKPNALILTAACVAYNFEKGIIDRFETGLDFDSQFKAGRHIEGDTFLWWMKQSEAARQSIQQVNNGSTAHEFEEDLFEFFDGLVLRHDIKAENIHPLSFGANFDIPIIEGFVDNVPWHYRNICCWRTWGNEYRDIIDWDMEIPGMTRHSAMSDATWQATAHLELMKLVERVR